MAGNTSIQIPTNLSDPIAIRRTLIAIVEAIDIAFNNKGNKVLATESDIASTNSVIDALKNLVQQEATNYLRKDGSAQATGVLKYSSVVAISSDIDIVHKKYADNPVFTRSYTTLVNITNDTDIPHKKYVDDKYKSNVAIPNLSISASSTYQQSEVQAIITKVNDLLNALRGVNIIS